MKLKAMKEAIDRIATEQKLFLSNSQEVIDEFIEEIQQASSKIQTDSKTSILEHLKAKVNAISSHSHLKLEEKDLNRALTKYTKLLHTYFNPDISKVYRNVEMDSNTVNQIILTYFYQQCQFDLGDFFVKESNIDEIEASVIRNQFWSMNSILQSFRKRKLKPALTWIAENEDKLKQNGFNLELKLRLLEFVTIVQKQNGRIEGIKYAAEFLTKFPPEYKGELVRLLDCLVWAERLEKSPFSELLSPIHWGNVGDELKREYYESIGRSERCPMSTTIAVGIQSLPILLKMMKNVIKGGKEEWEKMEELPIPVELDREFEFHSIFVCAICREQSNHRFPVRLSCGHMFCFLDTSILWRDADNGPFKCPHCTSLCDPTKFRYVLL